ncbi:hypothetical protein ACFP1I_12565 [Dyadobacter subterraneus]|uniref:DUF3945 domain-containing protein n=1 Tax=Dyadobacter subterraneus TaxID=2773304 RepID=A0ABR9W9H5_9BACT|nr:hypothetical protein [Dyadobacter subterraneus]MBE9462063.1 hypothetical protein [Dyadobacter subterraneus]
MNEKNFEYLTDQLKFTGFDKDLNRQLKENMAQGSEEFRLEHTTAYGQDQLSFSLHFKKSAQGVLYFFNSYTASLKKHNQPPERKQTFYVHKQASTITQKEAFNLLDGRAVNKDMLISKEGKKFTAWIQLDFKETAVNGNFKFKHFSQGYGFDLEKSLEKFPIRELSDKDEKTRLIESLQKGNLQLVTLAGGSGDQKVFVQANPQFKSVTAFDQNQHRLTLDWPKQTENQTQQQSSGADDLSEAPQKSRAQRRL